MDEDDCSINVSCFVTDYLNHRIQKEGYSWQTSPTRNCPDNRVLTVSRKLCAEFEKRYGKKFTEMCLVCGKLELNAESFNAVLDNLIVGGLNWGRVIGVLTFAGAMAVHSMDNGAAHYVDLIREWTCAFIQNHVIYWINQNDGWKGLVDFYDDGVANEQKQQMQQNGWGTILVSVLRDCANEALVIVNRA